MTIDLGRVERFETHLLARETDPDMSRPPTSLCTASGGTLAAPALHTWTRDPAKVTCADCLEWMHA